MNQRNIDGLIPVAVDYLSKTENKVVKDWKVIDSTYSSYINTFGPTIIQSGMMKALAVYGKKEGGSQRFVIDDLIKQIMIKAYVVEEKYKKNKYDLIDIYLEKIKGKDVLERMDFEDRILETIVACKLALQLFHIDKSKPIGR